MPHVPIRELHELASLYGVQPAYQDVRGDRQPATPEALLAMLQLLGTPVATFDDVPSAPCRAVSARNGNAPWSLW